jgi:Cu(I)/Ag(I) efflux system periplasmic protein CusF
MMRVRSEDMQGQELDATGHGTRLCEKACKVRIRPVFIVLSATVLSGAPSLAASDKPASRSVQGVGVVTAIAPDAGRLTINHEDIKGFMGAMEMAYPVARPALLNGLKPGDKIRFVINRRNGTIIGVTITRRTP